MLRILAHCTRPNPSWIATAASQNAASKVVQLNADPTAGAGPVLIGWALAAATIVVVTGDSTFTRTGNDQARPTISCRPINHQRLLRALAERRGMRRVNNAIAAISSAACSDVQARWATRSPAISFKRSMSRPLASMTIGQPGAGLRSI